MEQFANDLTFKQEFGDSNLVVTNMYYSGGTFPFTATDVQAHTYSMAGQYDVKVRVRDDDGGVRELIVVIIII